MVFKSKVDWWMWLVFWAFAAATVLITCQLLLNLHSTVLWIVTLVMWVFEIALMLPIFFCTYYRLDKEELYVRCWLLSVHIPYDRITEIKETKNPLASLALSLDRLEIQWKTGTWSDTVLISPKNKQEFIGLLAKKRG
jgi:membrane protein YdbS with pleckstrin-like domain